MEHLNLAMSNIRVIRMNKNSMVISTPAKIAPEGYTPNLQFLIHRNLFNKLLNGRTLLGKLIKLDYQGREITWFAELEYSIF